MRLAIQGPPGVGKSTIARQLALHYKIHHVHMRGIIEETIGRLEQSTAPKPIPEEVPEGQEQEAEPEPEDPDLAAKIAEDQELLDQIREQQANEETGGRLQDELILRFFREKLLSKPCQNQGFILDAYPKFRDQCKDLFARELTFFLLLFIVEILFWGVL